MRNTEAESHETGASRLKKVLQEMHAEAGDCDVRMTLEGMRRFGIRAERIIGLNTPQMRKIAKRWYPDQPLAEALWETGIHEARLMAALIGDPKTVDRTVMNRWVRDFNSWDVCDACCCNLFDRSPFAWQQIAKWVQGRGEFVRRAGFATIAAIAVHDKAAEDRVFVDALQLVEQYAFDDRNFVKKGVNWALRNIGKRNSKLRLRAMVCAERVRAQGTRSARWIAADALRELKSRG